MDFCSDIPVVAILMFIFLLKHFEIAEKDECLALERCNFAYSFSMDCFIVIFRSSPRLILSFLSSRTVCSLH